MSKSRHAATARLSPLWPELSPTHWRRLRARLSEGLHAPTLDDALRQVAGLVVACATQKTAIPLDDPSRLADWAASKLGLSPESAKLLATQLSVLPAPLPLEPDLLPDALDLAGPLVDRFAPRKERKTLGLFVTAAPVAEQMARLLLDGFTGLPCLLDNATGTATLPLAVLRLLHAQHPSFETLLAALRRDWSLVEQHPLLAAMASLQLIVAGWPHWPPGRDDWPVRCGDGLAPQARRFTHAIGNPPYRGEKQAAGLLAEIRARYPDLDDVHRGKADLSFFFVLRVLLSLEADGRLVLLTPTSWTTADGAKPLRRLLRNLAQDIHLHSPLGRLLSVPGLDLTLLSARRGTRPLAQADGSGFFRAGGAELESLLAQMAAHPARLGGPQGHLRIHSGIQTGADRVEGRGCFILTPQEAAELIPTLSPQERSLLKPLVKSPALGPFVLDPSQSGFLIYLDGSLPLEALPRLCAHLEPFRRRLSLRREVRLGKIPWWRLHWPRKAEIFESPSLLIPQRATRPRAAIAPGGAYTSVDVYHGVRVESSPLSLFGWAALFHSLPVALWLAHRGKRKGRLFELYRTPLEDLPLPAALPPDIAQALNETGERIHREMLVCCATRQRNAAWYLDWEKLATTNTPAISTLRSLLAEADRLTVRLYNLNHKRIGPLRATLG